MTARTLEEFLEERGVLVEKRENEIFSPEKEEYLRQRSLETRRKLINSHWEAINDLYPLESPTTSYNHSSAR